MTITRRNTLELLAGAACAALLPARAAFGQAAAETESLAALAQAKGMHFGCALGILASDIRRTSRYHNLPYRDLIARQCHVIVTENETKWQAIHPAPHTFNFAAAKEMFAWAKEMFAWAKAQGMLMRGHTLIWQPEKWLPKWVNEYDFGAQPAREAERLLREHISIVCRHFGASIYSYDVDKLRSFEQNYCGVTAARASALAISPAIERAVSESDGTCANILFHCLIALA